MSGHTLYADAAQLAAWLASAAPGQRITYATGPGLDPGHPVKALVADWVATGEVLALQQRHPVSRELMYVAQRRKATGGALAGDRANVRPAASMPPVFDEGSPEDVILRALARAANMGLPCPSNAALAEEAGLHNPDAASWRVRKLRDAGLIRIDCSGTARNSTRVVTIAATGRRTVES